MSVALLFCVSLILHIQSINWAQFLIIISLSLLFGFITAGGTGATVIVSLANVYGSFQLHKLDSRMEVLNLIWVLVLYVPREP